MGWKNPKALLSSTCWLCDLGEVPLKGENHEPSPLMGTCRVQCWVGKVIAMTPGMFWVVVAPGPLVQYHPPQRGSPPEGRTRYPRQDGGWGQPSPEEQAGETGVRAERLGESCAWIRECLRLYP